MGASSSTFEFIARPHVCGAPVGIMVAFVSHDERSGSSSRDTLWEYFLPYRNKRAPLIVDVVDAERYRMLECVGYLSSIPRPVEASPIRSTEIFLSSSTVPPVKEQFIA